MAESAPHEQPYRWDSKFERTVVWHCCRSPRFWGLVGREVDPDLVVSAEAKLTLQACRQIAAQSGSGPDSPTIVIQRLMSWVEDGKFAVTKVQAVDAYLEDAETDPQLSSEAATVQELAPKIQERIRNAAAVAAIHDVGRKGDMQTVRSLMDRADRVGVTDVSVGTPLSIGSFSEVERMRVAKRLPTGIQELDNYLDGGMPLQGLAVVMGGTGDGKSMWLSHVAANVIAHGGTVCYATLELPRHTVTARLFANITGIPINEIYLPGGEKRVRDLLAARPIALGECYVKDFTPEVTTVGDLDEWQKECEDLCGKKISLMISDYGDLLSAGGTAKNRAEHEQVKVIYNDLKQLAVSHNNWGVTASQSQGRKERDKVRGKRQILDLQHVAGGAHKFRVADLGVTLNFDDDTREMSYLVAKFRHGNARKLIGPMATDLAIGAVAPIARNYESPEAAAATRALFL